MTFQVSAPIEVPDELLDEVVERVVAILRSQASATPEPYMDVESAAAYLGCKDRRRIYDLVEQGRLRVARDGRRLLTRRSWLDAALDEKT
jgi:excisionase family DNA binding protein